MMELEIVLPRGADMKDALDHGLVALTTAICQATGEESGYGLGGRFGYGENFENDTFMMHRFCWCDLEDCRWCSDEGCGCDMPDGQHFVDGKPVSEDEYWATNRKLLDGKMPHDVAEYDTPEYWAADATWEKAVAERDRRLHFEHAPRVHTCHPQGMMQDQPGGAGEQPSQTAPNFWHKRTGLKVWWYKWIGRSQEVANADGVDLQAVFSECIASLRS